MAQQRRKYNPFKQSPFFIKLYHREFWPMWANYLPVYFYYLYLSIRERSLFWFSAANPTIETGGMMGESKMNILNLIPNAYKPISIFIPKGTAFQEILQKLQDHNVDYPFVIKPDIGERGLLVEKINNEAVLKTHIERNDVDYIIQPYVDYTLELAIMYYHFHDEDKIHLFSIAKKGFLSIEGDGESTMEELVMSSYRAILQLEKLKQNFKDQWNTIIPKGKYIELEPIGNHSRGTAFLDANYLISNELEQALRPIAKAIDGVYFGRFDMRVKSEEDLRKGQHIAILEINGVGAEPAHIYDPGFKLLPTYKTLLQQWKIMHQISRHNHQKLGVPYMTLKEARAMMRMLKSYKNGLNL